MADANSDPGGLLSLMQTGGIPPGMMLPSALNGMTINQNTGLWNAGQSTADSTVMSDPYGGKSLRDVVIGGLPYAQDVDANNNPYGGGDDATAFQNQRATNENVSQAIQRGGKYQPSLASVLQSSGPQGGWFSTPGNAPETNYPWGLHPDPRENPAPGLLGMSTNNYRLLPEGYQNPAYAMRAGHIINRYWTDKPLAYAGTHGAEGAPWNLGGPGHGFPTSIGSPSQRGYFFPGQIEPWLYEGGPGTS